MKLMEYQGKDLFRRVGIPTPKGYFATSAGDVATYIAANPGSWVLKSQVLMGGRGKAGGIKFADDAKQGETIARELIGKILKSIQNPEGEEVRSLLVEEKVDIASEAYVSITIDRATKRPVVIVTSQGGMDVEEVAEKHPDAISKYWIDPAMGYSPFIGRKLAFDSKLPEGYRKAFPSILGALYTLFMDYGANLVEINPLVLTKDGRVIASDAKVELDDNGLYKHPDVAEWNKKTPADEDQAAAVAIGLGMSNYAKFADEPGEVPKTIGTIANGAGLGMGTMDAVKNAGGGAANFLDIGGGASATVMAAGLDVILGDPQVKSVFVNVFGGITSCVAVAEGIVKALEILGDTATKPLVVRLDGNQVEEGRAILAAANNPLVTLAAGMDEGADKAAALANAAATA